MFHVLAAAQAVPAYCKAGIHTPAQIPACLKAGWSEPTTGAANAGLAAGHAAPWVIIAGIIIGLLWIASRGSRRTATSS